MKTVDAAPAAPAHPSSVRASRWILPAISGLLLAGVLTGFAKTFFLRSQFGLQPMPSYLYVHGAVLTTWFVLVVVQALLVARYRIGLHRRLGVAAVAVAALIIPISAFVVVRAAQRANEITPLLRLEVVGDILTLIWFAAFVAAGVYFRRRPAVHKRLMVASCFTIYGPVFARMQLVYGLPLAPPLVIPAGVAVLATYDLVAARRVHRATMWIALAWLGGLLPLLGGLIVSGAADRIINALR